jgi:hypothetical protein
LMLNSLFSWYSIIHDLPANRFWDFDYKKRLWILVEWTATLSRVVFLNTVICSLLWLSMTFTSHSTYVENFLIGRECAQYFIVIHTLCYLTHKFIKNWRYLVCILKIC